MTEQEKFEFYTYVSNTIKKDPDAFNWAVQGITDGIKAAIKQAKDDQVDWEIVAFAAMEKRYLDGNILFIADKIENIKSRGHLKWDWFLEKLKAIAERRKAKDD